MHKMRLIHEYFTFSIKPRIGDGLIPAQYRLSFQISGIATSCMDPVLEWIYENQMCM